MSSGYRAVLRLPGAAAFFCTAAAGRIGIAMTGLGLLWLLHARTGSYGTAGLATAGFALAEAGAGPQLARLADRFGQPRVLPFSVAAHGIAGAGVLFAPPTAAVAFAACAGATVPQLGALSAARWAHLLRSRPVDLAAAFSLESLANATAFLLGPMLATALGAAGHAPLASGLAGALIVTGGAALAGQRRTAPPPARVRSPLFRRGFVRLALLNSAVGLYFGTMGVSVSAFATQHGVPGAATPIVAAGSIGGLVSGWLYGRRRYPARLRFFAAYLTATALLLPFAPSAIWLGVAVVVTEAAIPPTLVLLNVRTEQAVDPGVRTEAFTWNNSASAAGSALAAFLAGHTADALGASTAFALAPAAGLALFALAVTLPSE